MQLDVESLASNVDIIIAYNVGNPTKEELVCKVLM